ncbi:MAG: methyltransferase domain-containing protein [Candidatus Eisenbacteria bacterium]|nr:methyltransferase domain-containing protein [Candidatus Eisenbacteria bacterium]
MDSAVLEWLRCPMCHGELEVVHQRTSSPSGRMRDGLLACRCCSRRYPVLEWIPRMLPRERLNEAERLAIDALGLKPDHESVPEIDPQQEERRRTLERRLMEKRPPGRRITSARPSQAGPEEAAPAGGENDDAAGAQFDGAAGTLLQTAQAHVSRRPHSVLVVGGGLDGTASALQRHFLPQRSMIVDHDPDGVELARLRNPECIAIRAEPSHLPFADRAADLLVATATLEHLPRWKTGLREMVRVSEEGLVSYGPNRRFPFDMTRLDAPVLTWLPASTAAAFAWVHHRLKRNRRSLSSLRTEAKSFFYIPRQRVVHELKALGCEVQNVFADYLKHAGKEETGAWDQLLPRLPTLRRVSAHTLVLLAAEPSVCLFFRHAGENQHGKRAREGEQKAPPDRDHAA